MANARDAILRQNKKAQAALLRVENRLARDVARAYEAALRELQADFVARVATLPDVPTVGQLAQLASDRTLINAIDNELKILEDVFTDVMRKGISDVIRMAFLNAQAEVLLLASALNITFFRFGIDTTLAFIVESIIDQIPGEVANFNRLLKAELRQGLISGDKMQDIAQRVFSKTSKGGRVSVFRRGMTSANLFTRRAVVDANNDSKMAYLRESRKQVSGLKKQAVAAIAGNTTRTCLNVHGQVKEIDQPFVLTAEPRFARRMQRPGFHWNCRTVVVAYHADFEESSTITTDKMRADAREELDSRRRA